MHTDQPTCRMPAYKLHYFNARGRAEPIRLCFEAAGVKYEDIRYTMEEWKKLKREGFSPNGHLPVFEVDGKKLCESIAILKYIARELGFSPSDSFQVAQCDQICEAFKDILSKMENEYYEKDQGRKKTMKEEFDNNQLPTFLNNMTRLLKSNNDGKGFFVGDKLSYADLVMSNFYCFAPVASAVEKFPELKAHSACIGRVPGIKEWIKNRPQDVIPPP